MKKLEVVAYNGTGKEKVLAGKREVDFPETVAEALTKWPEDEILEYIKASYVIEIQRQIRSGTTMSAKQVLAQLQAFAKANPDSDVAKTLKSLEITTNGETQAPTPQPAPEQGQAPAEQPTPPAEPEKAPAKKRGRK